jgi:hypothetical protein
MAAAKPTPKPTPKAKAPVKKTYDLWGTTITTDGTAKGTKQTNTQTGQVIQSPTQPYNPLGSTLSGFSALTRPAFWERVGIFALGVALIWAGILIAIASNKKVQQLAGSAIGGAVAKTPQGVAANLATGALA